MAEDYPAAHSADTHWFAVDRDGCVARFWSDEDGAIPSDAFTDWDCALQNWLLQHRPARDVPPDDTGLACHGCFEYSHVPHGIAGPYALDSSPEQPLHIDELPPHLRKLVAGVRFDLRFVETPDLQPAEHAECQAWGAAYLDVTGKHIRPIRGKEQEYGQIYAYLVEDNEGVQVEQPPQ